MKSNTSYKTDALWVSKTPNGICSLLNGRNGEMSPNFLVIKVSDIRYATTGEVKNYVKVVTTDKKVWYRKTTLKKLVETYMVLVQCKRSLVVSTLHVTGRYDWLKLWSGETIFTISKQFRKHVILRMNKIVF